MDWFLYDIGLRHERVKKLKNHLKDDKIGSCIAGLIHVVFSLL